MTDIDIDPFNSDRAIFNTGFGLFQTTNLSAPAASRVWTFFNDALEELVPLALFSPSVGPPLVTATGDYTGFRLDNLNRSPRRGALQPMNGSNGAITGAALASQRMVRQHSTDTLYSSDAGASWSRFATVPAAAYNGHHRTIFSADGTTFLWTPTTSGAYISTNNGATWTASTGAAIPVNASTFGLTVNAFVGTLGTAGSSNGTGTAATFNSPEGVALASDGRRYVADTANHTIRTVGAAGAVATLAGTPGSLGATDATGTAARFNAPSGIVFANGFLYVADTANHTIRRIAPANASTPGVVTTFAGTAGASGSSDGTGSAARFNSPRGLAADSAGNLYVADTGNHTIRKITSAGVVTTLAGTAGLSGTTNATGSAARFNAPRGLAVDSAGNVYVADTANHALRRITPAGVVTTFAGSPGVSGTATGTGGAARFNSPRGLAIDSAGILHVADSGNHLIRRVTPAGVVTNVAGTAGSTGTAGGENTSARFNSPSALVCDPQGYNLYIADTANHGVRRASAYRTLTPVADSVEPGRLYVWSKLGRTLLSSTDGGVSFTPVNTALPTTFELIRSVPGRAGHLWARTDGDGLYSSINYGVSWTKLPSVTAAYQFGFGRAAPGATHPAVYAWAQIGGVLGFYRSDNAGSSWTRINTSAQQFGYINDLTGDPRVYGRVYLATSGRGVVVGELAAAPAPRPSSLVYGDGLAAGWANASTSSVSLSSSATPRRGSAAISLPAHTSTNTYAFSATTAAYSTVGQAALSFWVSSGTSAPPPLRVGASRGGVALEAYPVPTPTGTGWQRVLVPLADLGLDNIDDLTGLRIEAYAVNGVLPGAVQIDDIAFIGLTDFTTPTQIQFTGLSAAFDGLPKSAVVTTIPAGRGVVLTYDGSPSAPSAIGTYAVVATLLDPFATGSASETFRIRDANASIQLGDLTATADGSPKAPSVTTVPAGLAYVLTYDGSTVVPSLPGNYAVVATITDPLYAGSASAIFTIRQPAIAPSAITGWASTVPGKVAAADTASPLFTPDDTTDSFSSNPLHARFPSLQLLNLGDTLTVTGTFQLASNGVAGVTSWFRFGLFDHRDQAADVVTGWLGGASIGGNYWERTSSAGLFTTGTGATSRAPDASPSNLSANAPAGTPPVAFTLSATRTTDGVALGFQLRHAETGVVYLQYTYTDPTPNNDGTLGTADNTASDYTPAYNTVGFAFGRTYLGATPPQVQFTNLAYAFTPGAPRQAQTISFAKPADRPFNSAPFALSATASSGLPVSFAVVSGPATLEGSTLTLTGSGNVTVRATQAGDLTYEAAAVEQTFLSTKLPATIAFTSLVATHDGAPKTPSVSTTPAGLATSFAFEGLPGAPAAAGSYPVVASIADATYQGQVSGLFVIEPGPQTITFPAQPGRGVGATFSPGATASSGLPVAYLVVSGPATSDGASVTITGLGTVVLRATQLGDANYLPAPPVEQSVTTTQGTATIQLGDLAAMYDGQPKPVSATTQPAGLAVSFTYDGSPVPPSASGSYAVIATVQDPNFSGSASGTLTIAPRSASIPATGWRVTNSTTVTGAQTDSPLLNAANGSGTSGASTSFYTFFEPVTLARVGDSVRLTGSATVNAPGGIAGRGLWFRYGIFDNRDLAVTNVQGWLGYVAMANSVSMNSLFERTGSSGGFSTSFTGVTARTVDASPAYAGANSPSGSFTLTFEQTITRFASHVTVVSRVIRPGVGGAADTTLLSSTYTDTTPNNNGQTSGAQDTALVPIHSPRYNALGFTFSSEYLDAANTSSIQFDDVAVRFTSGADVPAPVITFEPLADRAYSAAPIPLVATSSSGQPVVFTVVSGPATLSGANLSLTGVGSITLRASQPGTLNTPPAAPVERTFEVTKVPAAVLLEDVAVLYDGSPKSVTATTVPAGLEVVVTYDGQAVPPTAPGTYEIAAAIVDPLHAGEASATLVIQQIPQTIAFAPLPGRTLGDAPFVLEANSTSGLNVDFSVVAGPAVLDGATLTLTGAGEVTLRASQPGNAIFAAAPDVERSFTVASTPDPDPVLPGIPVVTLTRGESVYELRVPSVSGFLYQLQRAGDLSAGDWANLGSARAGDGSVLLFTDPMFPEAPRRFYRVVIAPAP
jgi:sugar lactone lactonase YvrE